MGVTVVILTFSCLSLVLGTVLLILSPANQVIGGGMISAALGGFWREMHVAKRNEADAHRERQKAEQEKQAAQEETQQIAQELFERTGITRRPTK